MSAASLTRADRAPAAVSAEPAPSSPPRRRASVLPLVALGLLVVVAAAWVQDLAWDTTTYMDDERWTVVGGRLLAGDLPAWIFDFTYFDRGPERLTSVLMVLPDVLFASVPGQLRAIHVVLALAYFLTAVPVFWLARGMGLGQWPAVLVAALAVITPWVVYGATLLTVTVALPANTFFAWAVWRAATRPSLRFDALVLLAAAVNTLARTGHAPLAAAAVPAFAYAVWLRRPGGEGAGRALLLLPWRVVRTHPLLGAAFALAVVVVLALGIDTIVGSAYESAAGVGLTWESLWFHLRDWFMQLTMATGYLPMIVGLPWLLWQVVRPSTPERGTFAALALGLFASFVYITSAHGSVSEERYVSVFAALPAVAFGAAVFLRQAWPLGSLIVGLLAARAIDTLGPFQNSFEGFVGYLVAPGRNLFPQLLGENLDRVWPGDLADALFALKTLVPVLGLLAALVCAPAIARRIPALAPRRTVVALAVSVPVLLFGVVGAGWALDRYEGGIEPGSSLEERAWVDAATGGEPAFLWSHWWDDSSAEGRIYAGLLVQHFNESTCCNLWVNDVQDIVGPDGELPGEPTPFLVRFAGFYPLGFESETVATERNGPETLRTERLLSGHRAALEVFGVGPDGSFDRGRPADLQLFENARRPGRCVSLELVAPFDPPQAARFGLRAGSFELAGRVRPAATRRIVVPIGGASRVRVRWTDPRAGEALRLSETAVVPCPS